MMIIWGFFFSLTLPDTSYKIIFEKIIREYINVANLIIAYKLRH